MGDISKGEGRTVLFVSHNMTAVSSLCNNSIVLKNGIISFRGGVIDGINSYLQEVEKNHNYDGIKSFILNQKDESFKLQNFNIYQDDATKGNFCTNKEIVISISYNIIKDIIGLRIGFDLIDLNSSTVIFRTFHNDTDNQIQTVLRGNYFLNTAIPANFLKDGSFGIKLIIGIHNKRWIVFDDNLIQKITLNNLIGLNKAFADNRPGIIMPQLNWQLKKNK